MFRAFATFVALCVVVCGAQAGKVSVEASSSDGKAQILVNGEPVEPGQREIDGSHINYQHRSESGSKGSCRYSSVSVTSSGDEPTKINVQQGSGCDADDSDFDFDFDTDSRGRSFGFASGSHRTGGQAHWRMHGDGDDEDGFPRRPHRGHNLGRDVRDRRGLNIDDIMNELRRGEASGNGADDFAADGGTRRTSNSGSGKPGEKREVHVDGEGVHARARTSGSGPHHETIETSTRRSPGGGVMRSVSVSASSSSGGSQPDA